MFVKTIVAPWVTVNRTVRPGADASRSSRGRSRRTATRVGGAGVPGDGGRSTPCHAGSRRPQRCRGPRRRRRWRPARGSAAPDGCPPGSGQRAGPQRRVAGSWVRSTDSQCPCPESSPVPVQVTQTCWTPADGSPVDPGGERHHAVRRRCLHVADARRGRRARAGCRRSVVLSSPRVEEPQVQAGVRCARCWCSAPAGSERYCAGVSDQRGAPARARARRSSSAWPAAAGRTRRTRTSCSASTPRWPAHRSAAAGPVCRCSRRRGSRRRAAPGPGTVTFSICLGSAGAPGWTVDPSAP